MNIALILSGGTGTRLGGDIPKQYIKVRGRMLIAFCLDMFAAHRRIDGIWIVADPQWQQDIKDECKSCGIDQRAVLGFSLPGETRQLSILNGLKDLEGYLGVDADRDDTVVVIHDAARPNLTAQYVDSCLDAMDGYDGVMPTLPMKDTVYYSESGKCVDALLDRGRIYAGQAPEAFRLCKYIAANESLLPDRIRLINGSTEPAVLAGLNIAMIPGDERNYKITTKSDLERFMQEQKDFESTCS